MNTAGLSLSDAPPFRAVYPFFYSGGFTDGVRLFCGFVYKRRSSRQDIRKRAFKYFLIK